MTIDMAIELQEYLEARNRDWRLWGRATNET